MKAAAPAKEAKPRLALLPKNIKTKDEAWIFGEDARAAGNHTLAINAYTAVLRWDPDHIDALKHRCMIYMGLKKYVEADQDAFRLQQLLPTSAVGYQLRGRAYIHREEYGKASFEFQLALSVEPDLQVLKLKEWTDRLITLSLERLAGGFWQKNTEHITDHLHSLLDEASEAGGNVNPRAAALFADRAPAVAGFDAISCVVEEELERHPDGPVVTAEQAALTAKNAPWPIGDEVDPHDCKSAPECIAHSYVRAKYSEDEHVPHIVNLVDTMPGGRQEVKRYYEREDEYVNSEAEDEGADDTDLLKADVEGSSTAGEHKAQKKKKRGGKARHKMKLQLDDDDDGDDDDAEDKQKNPSLFDKECELIIGAAWNYIKFELGAIEIGDHAVVFELEDVLVSSYPGFKSDNFKAIAPLTSKWMRTTTAPANPPVLKFFNDLRDCGATIFIVTSRLQTHRENTELMLANAEYFGYEQLIMRPELDAQNHVPIAEYKSRARAWISRWYTIVMTVGCQDCDLTGCSVGQAIKLPNHLYIWE